ncbi:MAG TPA: helix-turn-helix domain-containing protein [Terrimicrobiaceae bacterium]
MRLAGGHPRIVLVAVPRVIELDLGALTFAFAAANDYIAPELQYRVEVASSSSEPFFKGVCGLEFSNRHPYSTLKGHIDTLIVASIQVPEIPPCSPDFLRWLKFRAAKVRRVVGVGTGSHVLGLAGVLDGKSVATHWSYADELSKLFPLAKLKRDPIWVRDGNIYTSAGGSSVIDLSLALIEEDYGQKIALEVARMFVVFLHRPGNQAQFSVSLQQQTSEFRSLRNLQSWILENIKQDLSTTALAARACMSPRNFQRTFTKEIGESPARYVDKIRLEAARRKLERSSSNFQEIADDCGFGSAEIMTRNFRRYLKTTPREYRHHFHAEAGREPRRHRGKQAPYGGHLED